MLATCRMLSRLAPRVLCCQLVWMGAAFAPVQAELPEPIRGVWVANIGEGPLSSTRHSREFVDLCHECGINTLCVVVWNRGVTVYPSAVMQREFGTPCDTRYRGRDALRDIIDAAHEKSIRVWAWFEFGFSCSYEEPDGGPIIRRKPHWAALDCDGELVTKNGFQWMNAFHPEVQDFMLALIKEVVEQYDVDGIQGDDRLPANPSAAGYDQCTAALYAREHDGRRPPQDPMDAQWTDWRTHQLNKFAERMHHEVKAIRPKLVVATAPSIFPWSRAEYLQDWPTWVENGWVDVVSPQVYRDTIEAYRGELEKIVKKQVAPEHLHRVFPGVLVQTADGYRTTGKMIERTIEENRRVGLDGEIVFYDAALKPHQDVFKRLYQRVSARR